MFGHYKIETFLIAKVLIQLHQPNRSLTHSLAYLLTHLLTHSLTHSLTYSGMHEIVGPILYCIENELNAWTEGTHSLNHSLTHSLFFIFHSFLPPFHALVRSSNSTHILAHSFSADTIEAHSFWLFQRIMSELVVLYDPTPHITGNNGHPQIVLIPYVLLTHSLTHLLTHSFLFTTCFNRFIIA